MGFWQLQGAISRGKTMNKLILGTREYITSPETNVLRVHYDTAEKVKSFLSVNHCDEIEIWLDSQAKELAEYFETHIDKIPRKVTVMHTIQSDNRALFNRLLGSGPMSSKIDFNSNMVPTNPIHNIQQTIGDYTTTNCSGCHSPIAHNSKHLGTLIAYKENNAYEIHHLCQYCFAYVERVGIRPPEERKGWNCGNDTGYANSGIRRAAKEIHQAISFLCFGKRGPGGWKRLADSHPLIISLKELAKIDKETCEYANRQHDSTLFDPILPPPN